jgi:hypothetical protein
MPNTAEKTISPLRCKLSADSRFSPVDFSNDQIWELTTDLTDPPALTLQTTYGLRAHWMHLFPSFTSGQSTITDPRTFTDAPRLSTSSPAYARVSFSPFLNFDVQMEVYVPDSRMICGKISVTNSSTSLQNWRVAFNALLNPLVRGQRMAPGVYGMNTVLQGSTQDLAPVFYITGGPEPLLSPYPALSIPLTLQPGRNRTFTWALASLRTLDESFNAARQSTGRLWEADLLKMEMEDKRNFYHVVTPRPEENAVFEHSQRQAMQLLVNGPQSHPGRTFLISRLPDQGYSNDGSGNDYGPAWIGQTALNAWSYCKLILPGYPALAREILQAFLSSQHPDGFISNSLELSNHPSPDHAFPILSEITHLIHEFDPHEDWLRTVYPPLVRYLRYWFTTSKLREDDDLPVWTNAIQAGVDELPEYSLTRSDGPSALLPNLISPGLLALLYNECSRLIEFAHELGIAEDMDWLEVQRQSLAQAVDACWSSQTRSYHLLDAQTGMLLQPQKLANLKKNGKFAIARALNAPGRVAMEVFPGYPAPLNLVVTLHGKVNGVPVSRKVTQKDFEWQPAYGSVYCSTLFDGIDSITVQGLEEGTSLRLLQPGSSQEDISLLLPLWAGMMDQSRAETLINKTIMPRYLTEYGLSSSPRPRSGARFPAEAQVSLVWNMMVVEGLTRYGADKAASSLMQTLLTQSAHQWVQSGRLFPSSTVETGSPAGEGDSLNSLVPGLDFLSVLGVEGWSETGVIVQRTGTIFSPITVEYRRTTCKFLSAETLFQASGGETIAITAPPAKRILFQPGKENNGPEQT